VKYEKLDEIVASYREELLEKLKTWIAIPSVLAPKSAENAPFGRRSAGCWTGSSKTPRDGL
jgi:hypothetical protein